LKYWYRRAALEETSDSGVGNSWQEYPQKTILPFGRHSSLIIARGNLDVAFEPAMINLHHYHSHRLTTGGEGKLLLLQGFRRLSVSSDPDSAQLDFEFDLAGLNARQFNANPEAGGALKNVNGRAPLNSGITKIGEMDFRDLVGDLANLALEKPQTERTGFSAHVFYNGRDDRAKQPARVQQLKEK
jgi:hypothetical protein